MAVIEAPSLELPGTLPRPSQSRAMPGNYVGLFLVTLSTLMYEILLTRIFSVTMWYHFAFVAISVALFGMTVGALIVYLRPGWFAEDKVNGRLAVFSLLFSVSIVLSFLTQLSMPFVPEWSIAGVYSIGLLYLVISIPFVFSGVCVCLTLTRFPRQVSRLYAADLTGSAVGAAALVWLLNRVDAPSAVIAVAALPAVATICFAWTARQRQVMVAASAIAVVLLVFAWANAFMFDRNAPMLRLTWVGWEGSVPTYEESAPEYEKWNAFSRIKVDPVTWTPFGWGLSSTLPADRKVEQHLLLIDALAGTVLTRYSGDPQQIDHLKYDVTNLAHYIRKDANVLVVGVGGGRDILSALAFNQKSVTGVEINGQILNALNNVYGDFTGHLDRDPRVTFVNDEARSYIARSKDRYDILQVSLADTWAASTAGAYALSENSLYTVEAWDSFLDHLTPNGVLTVSRWYYPSEPAEAYRITALAVKALQDRGVEDPRSHIYMAMGPTVNGVSVATILVSPAPFSDQDLQTLQAITTQMKFQPVLTPSEAINGVFLGLVEAKDVGAYASRYRVNIAPPTDDKPFFFQMIRLNDLFHGNLPGAKYLTEPVLVLAGLTIAVLVLTFLCIVLPLLVKVKRVRMKVMLPFFIFFASIGFGFLIIEVSQTMRLSIFLGDPTYGLSVVLFSLLLFSGIGSLATERMARGGLRPVNLLPFVGLLALLSVFGLLTPAILHHYEAATTPTRILTAAAILAPMGLLMGMPFPIGMKTVSAYVDAPTPFLWGINGATSVCASVLAIAIALSWGISVAFWVGCGFYVIAGLGLVAALIRKTSVATS